MLFFSVHVFLKVCGRLQFTFNLHLYITYNKVKYSREVVSIAIDLHVESLVCSSLTE